MGVESAIPQIVSDFTQDTYRKALVFGALANRQYEGEAIPGGSVKVTTVDPASVGSYTKASGVTWSDTGVSARVLMIDQDKYIAQTLDNKDAVQSKPDLAAAIGRNIGYAVANDIDAYIAALYGAAGVTNGTTGSPTSITSSNVLQYFMTMWEGLNANNTPGDGLLAFIPGWLKTKLVLAKVSSVTDNAQAWANGYIGNVAGFEVFVSNNVNSSGTSYYMPMFFRRNDTIALAEQIMSMEQVNRESYFDTGWKARLVYGAKVMRPESLAVGYWVGGAET